MKSSNILFFFFILAFFVFAFVFTDYMNYEMIDEEGGSRVWLIRTYLLLDLVCFVVLFCFARRKYLGIHLVCLLWIIIMPLLMFIDHVQISDIIKTILWPLLFETTYLFCHRSVYRGDVMKKMFYILAIIGFVYFLRARFGTDRQTNTIYLCFLALPWLVYNTSKLTNFIIVFIFTVLALLSMKRSMMLSMVLMWSFYLLYSLKNRRTIIYTIIISVVLLGGLYVAYDRVDSFTGGMLTERVNKEETDEGRSREAIWALTISMIQQSSLKEFLTGHGHFGVRRDSWLEISAHNDFLEVLYDYGLVIFVLYLCLWRYVIKRGFCLYRTRSPLFLPYAASLSIFIVMSMVSHLILYATYFNYLVMFWGLTEAIVEGDSSHIIKQKK